jgi:hypothetical protein
VCAFTHIHTPYANRYCSHIERHPHVQIHTDKHMHTYTHTAIQEHRHMHIQTNTNTHGHSHVNIKIHIQILPMTFTPSPSTHSYCHLSQSLLSVMLLIEAFRLVSSQHVVITTHPNRPSLHCTYPRAWGCIPHRALSALYGVRAGAIGRFHLTDTACRYDEDGDIEREGKRRERLGEGEGEGDGRKGQERRQRKGEGEGKRWAS